MGIKKRSVLPKIEELLAQFPCVTLLGARQVGKSTLLREVLPNATQFDLENEEDRDFISRNPLHFLRNQRKPLILDEAQRLPSLFDALRVVIDENRSLNGQFLISGSSSPELLKKVSESLAGRVAIVGLSPFDWSESWDKPDSEFFSILTSTNPDYAQFLDLPTRHTDNQLLESCLYGGYPDPFLKRNSAHYVERWMANYTQTYVERDIRALFPGLKLESFKRFIKMLAISTSAIINYSNFGQSLDVSQPTAKHYFDIAEGTFLWRMLPSFQNSLRKRMTKMPKGHLQDSGLTNHLLRIRTTNDLQSHPNFGNIWEAFVVEHLIRNLKSQLIPFDYFHFRTIDQAEIDLILEGDFGIIPIEIKLSSLISKKKFQTLIQFVNDHQCPIGLVISNGEHVRLLAPQIYEIPATFL